MSAFRRICVCFGRDPDSRGSDVEAGHARYVEVKKAPNSPLRTSVPFSVQRPITAVPSSHSEDLSTEPLIDLDEKHTSSFDTRSCSSQSSVISVPSTSVTVLTSVRSDATDSNRNSFNSDILSAPPSYRSRRTVSPCPRDGVYLNHPVMAMGWLQHLQDEALRQDVPARLTAQVIGHNGSGLYVSREIATDLLDDSVRTNYRSGHFTLPNNDRLNAPREDHDESTSPLEPLPQLYHDLDELLNFEDWTTARREERLGSRSS